MHLKYLLPLLVVLSGFDAPALARQQVLTLSRPAAQQGRLAAFCLSVHDGDTMKVRLKNAREEKVRLVGIDTPEMAQKPWGQRARDFTRRLCLKKDVSLALDVEQRDRYGRLLAYVYVGNTFVNLELVKQGYATILTYPPNVAHVEAFQAAQKAARNQGLNIWAREGGLDESPREFRRRKRER